MRPTSYKRPSLQFLTGELEKPGKIVFPEHLGGEGIALRKLLEPVRDQAFRAHELRLRGRRVPPFLLPPFYQRLRFVNRSLRARGVD